MGFHLHVNCWCISVWQLKDLIATEFVSLLHSTLHLLPSLLNSLQVQWPRVHLQHEHREMFLHNQGNQRRRVSTVSSLPFVTWNQNVVHIPPWTPPHFLMVVFMMCLLISSSWQLTDCTEGAASRASPGECHEQNDFLKNSNFKNISTGNVMQKGWV